MKQSERAKVMKANFLTQREAGITIAEIARKYKVSVSTVYDYLGEIAREIGVDRKVLLYQPHSKFTRKATTGNNQPVVNPEEVRKDFEELLEKIDGILDNMERTMEGEE